MNRRPDKQCWNKAHKYLLTVNNTGTIELRELTLVLSHFELSSLVVWLKRRRFTLPPYLHFSLSLFLSSSLSLFLCVYLTPINLHTNTHSHTHRHSHTPPPSPCGSLINDRLSGKWHLHDYSVSRGELFNMSRVGRGRCKLVGLPQSAAQLLFRLQWSEVDAIWQKVNACNCTP